MVADRGLAALRGERPFREPSFAAKFKNLAQRNSGFLRFGASARGGSLRRSGDAFARKAG
jgi:hypothetical protein